jgi:hypothetical protein
MSAPPDEFFAFLEAQRLDYRQRLPERIDAVARLWQRLELAVQAGDLEGMRRAMTQLHASRPADD